MAGTAVRPGMPSLLASQDFPLRIRHPRVRRRYCPSNDVTAHLGKCMALLPLIPNETAHLVVTSPPYNLGKAYEKSLDLQTYTAQQEQVIRECVRILSPQGSLCWQVGNYVHKGEIIPLDVLLYPIFTSLGLRMRNRIVWTFEHGLHCTRRFSGRYETINWYTKSDDYVFNLDPVRVPQKYPGKKHFKGPKAGSYSCNPAGKNPTDVWAIPNVKHNHPEKTVHPCQFPVELIERLVLSMTEPGALVVDPFMGVGTVPVACIRHGRKAVGAECVEEYYDAAIRRIRLESRGLLQTRPMNKPIYEPKNERVAENPFSQA